MKKKIINMLFLFLSIGITAIIILTEVDMQELYELLSRSIYKYLALAFLSMMLFWVLDSFVMHKLISKIHGKVRYKDSLSVTLIGQLYNYLTPFASGGQPAQVYVMKSKNIPYSNATVVVIVKFLVFNITQICYSIILSIIKFNDLFRQGVIISSFIVIGITVNLVLVLAIAFIAYNQNIVKYIAFRVINILYRFKIVKYKIKHKRKVLIFVKEYTLGLRIVGKDYKFYLQLIFISIIQLTFFFLITVFVFMSLGETSFKVYNVVSYQAILRIAVSFVPIPGTTGAAEYGFKVLFGKLFQKSTVAIGLLLWRFITFYFGILFCGIVNLVVFSRKPPEKEEVIHIMDKGI